MLTVHTPIEVVLADCFAVPGAGVRLKFALAHYNIVELGQLLAMKEWELLRLPNVGRRTIKLLHAGLAKHGLALGDNALLGLGVAFDY